MKEKRGNRVKEARLEKAIRSKFQNSNNSDINAKIGGECKISEIFSNFFSIWQNLASRFDS